MSAFRGVYRLSPCLFFSVSEHLGGGTTMAAQPKVEAGLMKMASQRSASTHTPSTISTDLLSNAKI
jgi:hypothetical protein